MLEEALEKLEGLTDSIDRERIAERALRFLEIWSPPGGEGEIARLVASELLDAGAEDVSLDEEFPGTPSVIARLRGAEEGATIQWHAHLDAIATEHAPARREGDELIGRGAADMKGAIAANIESVRLLRAAGLPRRGEILITYHGLHEEGGSAPLIRLIERGIVGDAVIIGELGSGDQLVTSSRGLDFWTIDISRDGRAIHEVNASPDVVDPLFVGALALERLTRLRDGLASGTVEPAGSLFIGKFQSGDYYNRVPTRCSIAGTRRHDAGGSHAQVHDELEGLVQGLRTETGSEIALDITKMTDAYQVDPDDRVSRAVRRAHYQLTGEAMEPAMSGAAGNAADFVVRAGVPAVYYGCDYASAHSDRESTTIEELVRIAAVYAIASAWFLSGDEIDAPELIGEERNDPAAEPN
jgi:acetylornithine deacetylase/succinyl-diaminopimelate desuccinylase-like protein